jgi:hypothetical protein
MIFFLSHLRDAAAQRELETYDFANWKVEEVSGWEGRTPGREMSCVIYMEPEDQNSETVRCHFTVVFADDGSYEVVDAYAMTPKGSIFGSRGALIQSAPITP